MSESIKSNPKSSEASETIDGEAVQCLILFADIIGCSEISQEKGVKEYSEIIDQFTKSAQNAYTISGIDWWHKYSESLNCGPLQTIETKMAGDEIAIFLHPNHKKLREQFKLEAPKVDMDEIALRRLILFALALKLYWLLSRYNLDRLKNSKPPRDIGIGIHVGPVFLQNGRRQFQKDNKDNSSYHASEGDLPPLFGPL